MSNSSYLHAMTCIIDFFFQERMFVSLTDIISAATMLSVTPTVRDALLAFKRGDSRGTVVKILRISGLFNILLRSFTRAFFCVPFYCQNVKDFYCSYTGQHINKRHLIIVIRETNSVYQYFTTQFQ